MEHDQNKAGGGSKQPVETLIVKVFQGHQFLFVNKWSVKLEGFHCDAFNMIN